MAIFNDFTVQYDKLVDLSFNEIYSQFVMRHWKNYHFFKIPNYVNFMGIEVKTLLNLWIQCCTNLETQREL